MWKNLLPQGTRTIELCSGYALILTSFLMCLSAIPIIPELLILENSSMWVAITGIFGFIQVYSIYATPKLDILRCIMSWVAGCFWIWVAAISFHTTYEIEDIATLLLGISNLYGFVINFNLLHISWMD